MKKKMLMAISAILVMANLTGCGLIPAVVGGIATGITGLALNKQSVKNDAYDIQDYEDADDYSSDDYSYGDDYSDDYDDEYGNDDSEDGLNYTIPYGWELAENMSTDDKKFYVHEGHSNDSQPDNISFNYGTNRYKAEDHVQFRQAILSQLAMYAQTDETVDHINGQGTNTDAGDILYIFTTTDEDTGMKSVYAYVVGDYKYALFQETNFTGDESVDEDFDTMIRSFVWAD